MEIYGIFKHAISKKPFRGTSNCHIRSECLETYRNVKLFKKTEIPTHVDWANETLKVARRIHIPIITNPDCIFIVGDDSINLKEGEIWEVNNDKKKHSVHNNGDEDRVHLLIDWMEKTPEQIEGL